MFKFFGDLWIFLFEFYRDFFDWILWENLHLLEIWNLKKSVKNLEPRDCIQIFSKSHKKLFLLLVNSRQAKPKWHSRSRDLKTTLKGSLTRQKKHHSEELPIFLNSDHHFLIISIIQVHKILTSLKSRWVFSH